MQIKYNNSIKNFLVILIFSLFSANIFAQVAQIEEKEPIIASAQEANRRTALICLEKSAQAIEDAWWDKAYEQADLGIKYDPEIPDLWYLKALAAEVLNKPKAQSLELLNRALSIGSWVQCSRDSARILYADLLCDTCSWLPALSVLDVEPYLQSSDADYIRAKVYYNIGHANAAFELVKNARTLYPNDGRFPLIFFKNELGRRSNHEIADYAASLLRTHTMWTNEYPEILVYGAAYSRSNDEAERLLRAFNAYNNRSELATVFSLERGLISEIEALQQMVRFSATGLRFECLQAFADLLSDRDVIRQTNEWLTAFAGVLIFDTNSDGIVDLSCQYKRGRAETIRYDHNQDGVATWQANCDFGVPVSLSFASGNILVDYGVYPSVSRFEDRQNETEFIITAESLYWTPVDIVQAKFKKLNAKFFIPQVKRNIEVLATPVLMRYASKITVPSTEREGGLIRFTMLRGQPQSAVYYQGEKPYAFAAFDHGSLLYRNIDSDGDDFFEMTEIYDFNPALVRMYMTADEDRLLNEKLFGNLAVTHGTFMTRAVGDLNKDGRTEYVAEFLSGGARLVSWDTDEEADGEWNIRSVITDESQIDQFVHPVSKEIVTVITDGGKPKLIQNAFGNQLIFQDDFYENLFWIGEKQNYDVAKQVLNFFNHSTVPGVSVLDNVIEGKRLLVVSIGDFYFGEVFDE